MKPNNKNYNIYSTSEIIVGKWIDEKPIYRKVVNFGELPNNSQKAVAHKISNLETIVDIKAISQNTSSLFFFPLTFASNSLDGNISLYIDGANVVITTGRDRTVFAKTFVIIEYTKTTD